LIFFSVQLDGNTQTGGLFRASQGSEGIDIRSAENVSIPPHSYKTVTTNMMFEIPKGHFGLICGRSGLAFTKGVVAFNGVIDNDYTGEVLVLLFNHSEAKFDIKVGQRIAQLILLPSTTHAELADRLALTGCRERGAKGFGSSGQ
jgi:dUTP pyrophosphatase